VFVRIPDNGMIRSRTSCSKCGVVPMPRCLWGKMDEAVEVEARAWLGLWLGQHVNCG
jgi:hypothetical protein